MWPDHPMSVWTAAERHSVAVVAAAVAAVAVAVAAAAAGAVQGRREAASGARAAGARRFGSVGSAAWQVLRKAGRRRWAAWDC